MPSAEQFRRDHIGQRHPEREPGAQRVDPDLPSSSALVERPRRQHLTVGVDTAEHGQLAPGFPLKEVVDRHRLDEVAHRRGDVVDPELSQVKNRQSPMFEFTVGYMERKSR